MPFPLPRSFLAVCLAAALAAPAVFASGPGTGAANFLKIPVGARETALGGALTAAADNANAVFYNPAGLGQLKAVEISYSYNNYISGISQQWLAAAIPAQNGAWGAGLNYLNIGAFPSYDDSDNRTGSVSAYDLAAYLGYGSGFNTGLHLVSSVRYGAAVKHIKQKLDDQDASGFGADAGLLLLTGLRNLSLGLAWENLAASRLDFINAGAKPPRKFKTGASYFVKRPQLSTLLSLDFGFPEDGPRYVSAGMENSLYGLVSLRVGYSSFGDLSNGLSFGLGLGLPSRGGSEIRADYSYGSTYDLGNMHKFGLSCRFGAPESAQEKAPAAAPEKAPATVPEKAEGIESLLVPLYGPDPESSKAAAESLARLGYPRAIEHLIMLLSSEITEWRLSAVCGLALSGDSRAPEELEKALRDHEPEVRLRAALAIGGRGDTSQVAALEEALKKEESEQVKSAILEALSKLAAVSGAGEPGI